VPRPRKGVAGSAASFFLSLDVGSGTWDFVGLVGSGIPFKTKADGGVMVTTGTVIAGFWANPHDANDLISITARPDNARKVRETSFYCELVVGD